MYGERNIASLLDKHAVRRARHPAIIEGEGVITYGDLAPLVGRTAGHLRSSGIGAGNIVGVCLQDSGDHLVVMYGLARLGTVILPLDWRWNEPEKQRLTEFFGVGHVVV